MFTTVFQGDFFSLIRLKFSNSLTLWKLIWSNATPRNQKGVCFSIKLYGENSAIGYSRIYFICAYEAILQICTENLTLQPYTPQTLQSGRAPFHLCDFDFHLKCWEQPLIVPQAHLKIWITFTYYLIHHHHFHHHPHHHKHHHLHNHQHLYYHYYYIYVTGLTLIFHLTSVSYTWIAISVEQTLLSLLQTMLSTMRDVSACNSVQRALIRFYSYKTYVIIHKALWNLSYYPRNLLNLNYFVWIWRWNTMKPNISCIQYYET